MDETVRVEFDPPRQCEEVGKALKLTAEGEGDVWLPTATTTLEWDGGIVVAATIPRFIALDRGLIVVDCPQEENNDNSMTRDDWFLLGIAMALVIRGEPNIDVAREARKLARKLRGLDE